MHNVKGLVRGERFCDVGIVSNIDGLIQQIRGILVGL